MKNKRHLLPVCIAGGAVLFVSTILPICGAVVNLIESAVNAKINRMSMRLDLDQREHEAAAEVIKPVAQITQAIGFAIDNDNIKEDEEEYYG